MAHFDQLGLVSLGELDVFGAFLFITLFENSFCSVTRNKYMPILRPF